MGKTTKKTAKKTAAKKTEEPQVDMNEILQAINGLGKKVQTVIEEVNDLKEKNAILEGNFNEFVEEFEEVDEEEPEFTGSPKMSNRASEDEEEEEGEEEEDEDEEYEEAEEEDEDEEEEASNGGPGRKPKTYKRVTEVIEFSKEFPEKYKGSVPQNLKMSYADLAHALETCFEEYEGFQEALEEAYNEIHNS